jgi:hypothetical protein
MCRGMDEGAERNHAVPRWLLYWLCQSIPSAGRLQSRGACDRCIACLVRWTRYLDFYSMEEGWGPVREKGGQSSTIILSRSTALVRTVAGICTCAVYPAC